MRRPNGPDDHEVSGEVTAWRDMFNDVLDWTTGETLGDHVFDALAMAYRNINRWDTAKVVVAFTEPFERIEHVPSPHYLDEQTRAVGSDPTWCPGLRGAA